MVGLKVKEPSSASMEHSDSKTKKFFNKVLKSSSDSTNGSSKKKPVSRVKSESAVPRSVSMASSSSTPPSSSTSSTSSSHSLFKHFKKSSSAESLARSSTTAPESNGKKHSGKPNYGRNLVGVNDMLGVSGNVIASPRERPHTPAIHTTPNTSTSNTDNHPSPKLGLPSINDVPKPNPKKLEYNPYGLNTGLTVSQRLNSEVALTNEDVNILPFPLEDPNAHLPDEFKQKNTDLLAEYELVESGALIGSGASASVRKINKINRPKEIYALKKFVLFKNEKPNEFYDRSVKEYIIHKNLSNGIHIVKCFGLIKIPHQQNLTRAWGFVLEFCKMDLFSLVSKKGWRFTPQQEKLCIFKQLIYGVKFIHECDIVHRDLKPENVLLTFNGIVKITDFGVSEYGHNIPGDFSSGVKNCVNMVGSPPYTPPEVCALQGIPQQVRPSYNPFKMDLWASGMILFVIFYMNIPFEEAHAKRCQAYREYEQGYGNYMTKNPHFRKNDHTRGGPGIDYKFAKEFPNSAIARLAWRLCDPMAATRYNLYDIFSDPAFQAIEMCIDENEYECNFYHHEEHKNQSDDFRGKVEYGSSLEILATPYSSGSRFSRQSSFSSLYSNNYSKKTTVNDSNVSLPKVKSMLGVVDADLPSHQSADLQRKSTSSAESNGSKVTSHIGSIPKPTIRQVHSNSAPSSYNGSSFSTTASGSTPSSVYSLNHSSEGLNNSNTEVLSTLKEGEVADENGFVDAIEEEDSESVSLLIEPKTNGNGLFSPEKSNGNASAASIRSSSVDGGSGTSGGVVANGKPGLVHASSTASLDCLCTPEGLKPIKLGASNTNEVIPVEVIKKCGCCKIKAHHHFEIVDAYR